MTHTTSWGKLVRHHNNWNGAMIVASVIGAAATILAGCETQNQGYTDEIPRDVRGPAVGSGELSSKELENTTDVMLTSIVESLPDLRRDEAGRTVIVLDRLANKTTRPTEDYEIFIRQLRAKLNQSGAKYQITFVEDPRSAEAIRNRVLEDPLKDDYETPGMRPHYALTGDVYLMDSPRENYWDVFFRLVDLDPESAYRGEIRWEDQVAFRFAL